MLIPNPIVLAFATVLSGAVVLDRVAVVVGNRAVKTSDIERDLRASELLNSQPLDVSTEARKKAAQRLVEQELIRQEIDNGSLRSAFRARCCGVRATAQARSISWIRRSA